MERDIINSASQDGRRDPTRGAENSRGLVKKLSGSLALRFGAAIVCTEILVLAVIGSAFVDHLSGEIDRRVAERIQTPGTLMQKGVLKYALVADRATMTDILGEDLIDGMVVGLNGNVFHSLNPEFSGEEAFALPGIDPVWFGASATEGRLIKTREGGNTFLVSVTPLFTFDNKVPSLFAYVKVNTTKLSARKASIRNLVVFGTIACVLITSIIIFFAFQSLIFQRVGRAADFVGQVREGNLEVRLADPAMDELGTLEAGMNDMVDNIRSRTEQREAALLALRESEERLEEAQRIAHVGNWEWDISTNEEAWSSEAFRILGLPTDGKASHEAFERAVHPDDRERVRKSTERAFSKGETYKIEFRIVHTDGTIRHVQSIGEIVTGTDGKPAIILGTVQDITERKLAEVALRESEEQYRSLVETTPHGIQEIDISGRIVFANRAMCRILGYSAKELKKMNISDLLLEKDRKRVIADIARFAREQPPPTAYYNQNVIANGQVIDVDLSWDYKRNEQGEVVGFISIITDVTEHKLVKSQLTMSELEKRAALEALDHIPIGIVLVDEYTHVKFINRTAQDIVHENDGFGLRNNEVTVTSPKQRERLLEVVRETIESARNNRILPGVVVSLSRPSGAEPLSVMISTLWGDRLGFGSGKSDDPVAVLFVTDPERPKEAPAEMLQNLFGLTPAEARLTEKLVADKTLDEAAGEMEITKNTARQYLKNIFDKTGTNRQAQLVKLVMSTPVWMKLQKRSDTLLS